MCTNPHCLGETWCTEWLCCMPMEPPRKKGKRSKTSSPKSSSRFASPVSSPTMRKICKGYVPPNTDKATTWAVRVFNSWRQERDKTSTEKCPESLLGSTDVASLNRWLSRFVVECRREDGRPYPPSIFWLGFIGTAGRVLVVRVTVLIS